MRLIPKLSVGASAGPGAIPDRETLAGKIGFDEKWLRKQGLDPAMLSLIQVDGDSMSPTLNHGDDIMVDNRAATGPLRDGIHVIRLDDALMVKVLDGQDPTVEEIKEVIRRGVLKGEFFPVLCGASYKNKGIHQLLDAVVAFLPSPTDIENAEATLPNGDKFNVVPDDEKPVAALAFKIATDPFVGRLSYVRVYTGTLKAGSYLINTTKGVKERINNEIAICFIQPNNVGPFKEDANRLIMA
jgi:hypothetical protein